MLLSRFWYGVLALALGAAVFILFVAAQLYNRSGHRAMSEALSADSSAVEWFLNDDARKRSSALIRVALNPALRGALAKSSTEAKPGPDLREKARAALRSAAEEVPAELKFDEVWAVDAAGRVIASAGSVGFAPPEDWELGGYPVVADALHGWIRDDAWVWKGRILRVVARPVEQDGNGEPVGAVIGAKIIDDTFARAVTKRTGAAIGFYAEGSRVASGAPEGFDKANLDQITQDLKLLDDNKDYIEKGRSEVRVIGKHLGVVYARLPGEAWELGAGYAVGRLAASVDSPFNFLDQATNDDKGKVPTALILVGVLGLAALGLLFSFLEHTRPLQVFRNEAARFAKGDVDVLAPSRFRGAYRKIAADINDGVEKVAAKGGAPRKAADLEQVLGPIPAQPAMSAFSVPLGPGEPRADSRPSYPKPMVSPRGPTRRPGSHPLSGPPPARDSEEPVEAIEEVSDAAIAAPSRGPAAAPGRPPPRRPPPPPPPRAPGAPAPANPIPEAASAVPEATSAVPEATSAPAAPQDGAGDPDELAEWNAVYEEFLSVKQQCGEPTNALTFEKFKGTLQRNKDALVARHNCSRVRFTVYVKDGKAALKASPVK
ncbi:MXAN_5187 family protein [Sorangium sp. So ce854]|uniref:MXAN_5187 family protein n=1 Tax=Sorangium sp. So ce854 TaxID=3133322 RepID=UPI003F61124D